MQFESLAALMNMGGHGPYVWSAYGIFFLVLVGMVARCLHRRASIIRHLLQQAQLRQEVLADVHPDHEQIQDDQPTEGQVYNGSLHNKEQP